MISARAQILGPVVIGERSKIGAGAVVISDIPADATAVGVPAKVVRLNGRKVEKGMIKIYNTLTREKKYLRQLRRIKFGCMSADQPCITISISVMRAVRSPLIQFVVILNIVGMK